LLNLRKLAVLAITALLATGITGLSTVAGVPNDQRSSTAVLNSVTALINTVGDDLFSTIDLTTLAVPTTPAGPTQHYGPFASGSTDSGTCGFDWANDLFDRHFTVFLQANGITVVEQFKDGSFTTPASDSPPVNSSPGACETSPTPQGTIRDGVTGTLHGYFVIPLPAGTTQTSSDPSCVAGSPNVPCTTTGFIDSHFTPCYGLGTCSATTFFDHYTAPAQSLLENEWKNASPDRGGNSGDIRSANI
jgi:hypothetical protein